MQRGALGTVHVPLIHATPRISWVRCPETQECHPVVVLFLCGMNNLFALELVVVVLVISNGFKRFVQSQVRSPWCCARSCHVTDFLVSAVPKRHKNMQKDQERETSVLGGAGLQR